MKLTSQDDGYQRHQNSEHHSGKKTSDNTKNDLWNVIDEAQPREFLREIVDVGDGTDNSDGNGPKDDQRNNGSGGGPEFDQALPPEKSHVRPDHLFRSNANITRRHVQGLVVSQSLVSNLGRRLRVEFDECRGESLGITGAVGSLDLLNLGVQFGKFCAAPVDSVNLSFVSRSVPGQCEHGSSHLFANKRLESVCRPLIARQPLSSNASTLTSSLYTAMSISVPGSTSLSARLVSKLDQLDFCSFKLVNNIIALLDKILQFGCISGEPHALDIIKDAGKSSLVEVRMRDSGNQDGACRDAVRIHGRKHISLAHCGVKDQFTIDGEENEAVEQPAHENMAIEANAH